MQRHLDQASTRQCNTESQKIILVTDTTFFGSKYGVLVCRCPRLKRNLYFHELTTEKPEEYRKARVALEKHGYDIEAVTIDGKRGVLSVFSDIPVQLCQFHQVKTVKTYLTSRPKLDAGKELWAITLTLTISTEKTFAELLKLWETRWGEFIKEKSYQEDGIHWRYTHRRIRSAIRSLKTNLPHLFTYQKYPALKIPNTTNSIDGYFWKLKKLLNVHCGLTAKKRYKMIREILTQ